jgi:hypothetical protein
MVFFKLFEMVAFIVSATNQSIVVCEVPTNLFQKMADPNCNVFSCTPNTCNTSVWPNYIGNCTDGTLYYSICTSEYNATNQMSCYGYTPILIDSVECPDQSKCIRSSLVNCTDSYIYGLTIKEEDGGILGYIYVSLLMIGFTVCSCGMFWCGCCRYKPMGYYRRLNS